MHMRRLLLLLCLQLGIMQAWAQEHTLTGKVTDEKGSPLANVTVSVLNTAKKTTATTLTREDGSFNVTATGTAAELKISFVGYNEQLVRINGKSAFPVTLESSKQTLSDVVVVGYGTQKRKDVTGSVSTIKGDVVKNVATPSLDKYLAGQTPGVQASVPSGLLGQPARIRIRGTNSISNSAEPLYVVDGVPYISGDQGDATSYNPISDINPNDIETMDVLKDGAATAIYGSRAANGVILITTKRGRAGKAKLTYDDWFASARASKRFKLLDANQFVTIANEKFTNIGEDGPAHADPDGVNTDWQSVVLRDAFQQNHALSVSGATDQTNYFLSFGYANLKGTTVSNDLTKYNFRAKIEQKALDNHLTIGGNIAATYNVTNGLNSSSTGLSGNIASAIRALPNVSEFNADGTYNISSDGTALGAGANDQVIDDKYTNVGYVLSHNIYRNQGINLTGNAFAKVKIIEGLNIGTQIGVNYLNPEAYEYLDPNHGDGRSYNGYVYQSFQPKFRYNWQNTIDYTKSFGQHTINIVAGEEMQKTTSRYTAAYGSNLSSTYFGTSGNIIGNSLTNQYVDGSRSQSSFLSFFGRANYSFQDKYLVSATLRRDKISSLPYGQQGATLPGASLGWRVSKEEFFKENIHFINDLKLRGGYAKVGNVEIGDFPYAGTFSAVQYGDYSGVQYSTVANPNLKFETSKKIDVGMDVAFLKNRIQLTVDYFRNNIDNLILAAPTAPSLGVPGNSIASNVGKMYNTGWEFSVNTTNYQTKDFTWSSTLNFTAVKNQVTKLANNNSDITNTYNITRVGQSIGAFYGYQSAGVNPANGNPLWVKGDGSIVQGDYNTSKYYAYDPKNPGDESTSAVALTSTDKKILGRSNPTWYGGFNNTFTYKHFDLNVFFTYSGGNKIYNITRQESLNNQKFQNGGVEQLSRWTKEGQITSVPKLYYGGDNFINQNGSLNSRFLENGNFLRAQMISLAYTFPVAMISRVKLTNLRVYAQVQNAFVVTRYKGLDPELANSVTTNNAPGLDYNTNPVPRTYTVGLNLGF